MPLPPSMVLRTIDGVDQTNCLFVARIPTSEKLIEVDFEAGKPVRAGHR